MLSAAARVALALDQTVFPVQGPPGAGKTFTGARMICALVRDGKRVGITANSHKSFENSSTRLLRPPARKTCRSVAFKRWTTKHQEKDLSNLLFVKTNEQALNAMQTICAVGGGTSYFWARPDHDFASTCYS